MKELRTDFIDMDKIEGFGEKWSEAYKHNNKIRNINKGIMLASFGKFLMDRGFAHILVGYEGSGDSGDCFYAEGFKDDEYREALDNTKYGTVGEQLGQYHSKSKINDGKHRQKEVRELFDTYKRLNPEWKPDEHDMDGLEYLLAGMIQYDWYNNEGGQGEIIWHLKKEKIQVDGQQNYHGSFDCKEIYHLNGKEPSVKYKDAGSY